MEQKDSQTTAAVAAPAAAQAALSAVAAAAAVAEVADPNVLKKVLLPSGSVAVFFKRKGVALINAQRKADGDNSRTGFALLSEIIQIDGKTVLMEDIEQMDLFDVMRLSEVLGELGKSGQAPKP